MIASVTNGTFGHRPTNDGPGSECAKGKPHSIVLTIAASTLVIPSVAVIISGIATTVKAIASTHFAITPTVLNMLNVLHTANVSRLRSGERVCRPK